jgi:hypothetical protein
MGQVILPGSRDAQARARVWLPPGATKELLQDVISTCMVPVEFDHAEGKVKVCRERFYKGQERLAERHHAECAQRHEDVIRAFLQQRHPDIMKPQDQEYYRWMRSNLTGILEGRVKW